MGCEHEIQIQVLYGSTWVTIISFDITSRGGGFPLCGAVHRVKRVHGVDGNHGRHQKNIFFNGHCDKWDGRRINMIRFHESTEKATATSRNLIVPTTSPGEGIVETPVDPKIEAKQEESRAKDDDDYEVWFDSTWKKERGVYYSPQEFHLYRSTVRNLETEATSPSHPMHFYYQHGHLVYTPALDPVATWCKMAMTAGPIHALNNIRMPDEDDKVSINKTIKHLRKAQSALCATHTRFMSQFKPKFPLQGKIPHCIGRGLAHYLVQPLKKIDLPPCAYSSLPALI